MDQTERERFFKMMQQVHADKALRANFVANARRLAADPAWCAKCSKASKANAESVRGAASFETERRPDAR